MFQRELSKIQEAESSIKEYVRGRVEETEKLFKINVELINQEIVKLSKETYEELDQVDKEMQNIRQQIVNTLTEQPITAPPSPRAHYGNTSDQIAL